MTHLKVGVRVRPLSQREITNNSSVILQVEDDAKTVAVTNMKVLEQHAGDSRERTRRFTFDFCLQENASQGDVFQAIEDVIGGAIKRRAHSCILAYGQSASGKTHTMMGFPHDPGVVPRICENVFAYLEETAVGEEKLTPKVDVSYLEIYNEKVRDLLDQGAQGALKVRQHPKKGPYVQGLSSHSVHDSCSLLQLLAKGNRHRRIGTTPSNPQSSRSHAVFLLQFDSAKLTLVDLAGSERASAYTACAFREGANINKSLVALGNVISALADDGRTSKGLRRRFVPFRDSILTWLLKDTLGGNSETVMIATISPSSECYSETVNTLRFGQRAKLIVSLPVVNEDPKEKIIKELREEIVRLKELLKTTVTMSNTPNTSEKLLPMMDVTDTTKPSESRLRRTFSVDHSAKKTVLTPRKFGSEETVVKKPRPPKPPEPKAKVEAKVDSIRRIPSIKPRSQIVAAVTHRLYAKTKKKEVGTDTSDMPTLASPRELSICSNARLQLKELTKKALRSQKSKNEETQTELFPVLRVKEIGTEMDDLKSLLDEVKNAETNTEILTEDKEVLCTLLNSLNNPFIVTRSCGTQSQSTVSFTKYLQETPKIEVFNPHTANPIYTSSVNINISHNYINKKINSESLSDDSLDDQRYFPPDLISNHNSLEPHASTSKESIESRLQFATEECDFKFEEEVLHFIVEQISSFVAKTVTIPFCVERVDSIYIPTLFASEIVCDEPPQRCEFFISESPNFAKPNIVDYKSYSDDCITLLQPMVLKSIMKHIPDELDQGKELLDSLEYHKKVRFNKPDQNERMMKAMSAFLEEATILMNNLTMTSSRFECDYDIQVSIDGLAQKRRKKKKDKVLKNQNCQTENILTRSDCIQTEELDLTNKYELLLEDSCRRLEEKMVAASEDNLNLWDLPEDASLESNTRTSDYGSLPRHRKRYSSCTPSAYLRQLAAMRRQVVEAAREEFSSHSDS